jgi:hypothetical protein
METDDLEAAKSKELERKVWEMVEKTFLKWRVLVLKMGFILMVLAAALFLMLLLLTSSTH